MPDSLPVLAKGPAPCNGPPQDFDAQGPGHGAKAVTPYRPAKKFTDRTLARIRKTRSIEAALKGES